MCLTLLCKSVGFKRKMQSVAASRHTLSVTRFAEHGNVVAFRKDGGTIKNLDKGRIASPERNHGVYVFGVGLQTNLEGGSQRGPGFERQA